MDVAAAVAAAAVAECTVRQTDLIMEEKPTEIYGLSFGIAKISSCLSMISVSHPHHHHHSDSGGGSSVTPSRGSRSRSRSSSKERLLSKLADAAAVIDTPVGEDEIKGESFSPLVSLSVCCPTLPSLLHISIAIGRSRSAHTRLESLRPAPLNPLSGLAFGNEGRRSGAFSGRGRHCTFVSLCLN